VSCLVDCWLIIHEIEIIQTIYYRTRICHEDFQLKCGSIALFFSPCLTVEIKILKSIIFSGLSLQEEHLLCVGPPFLSYDASFLRNAPLYNIFGHPYAQFSKQKNAYFSRGSLPRESSFLSVPFFYDAPLYNYLDTPVPNVLKQKSIIFPRLSLQEEHVLYLPFFLRHAVWEKQGKTDERLLEIVSITNINRLMRFGEIIAGNSENHTKPINILWVKCRDIECLRRWYHCALRS
jgi:hypothetical protein